MTEPVSILCALYLPKGWSGGCLEYSPEWVHKLHRGFLRNTSRPFDFACLTNFPASDFGDGVRVIPYVDDRNVGNWLGITEVMRPSVANRRRIFLGLDSIVTGNVDWLLDYRGGFGMSANKVETGLMTRDHVSNAVCAWDERKGFRLWDRLCTDRKLVERESMASWSHGVPSEMVYWRQDADDIDVIDESHPGELLCFSRQTKTDGSMPESGSIVYFFGAWKPHKLPQECELRSHWI